MSNQSQHANAEIQKLHQKVSNQRRLIDTLRRNVDDRDTTIKVLTAQLWNQRLDPNYPDLIER